MKKKNNYYVIGGQYECCCYGGTPTLLGAKRLANKHLEFWDNWQGFRIPCIYRAEDTEIITATGWVTVWDGSIIRVPKPGAEPIA